MQPITCSHHMITLFLNNESLTGQKESDTGPLDYQRYQTCYADRRGLFNSIASIWFCERFFLFFLLRRKQNGRSGGSRQAFTLKTSHYSSVIETEV